MSEIRRTGVDNDPSNIVVGTRGRGWGRGCELKRSMLDKICRLIDSQEDGGFNEEPDSFTKGDL